MLGSEICRQLAAAGKPVRAMVRATSDPVKVEALKGYGVEVVEGDVRDAASLAAACSGATAVISTVSSMPFCYQPGENDIECVDEAGVKALIDAARATGVGQFVYTSFSMELDFPLHNAKRAVEQHLKESGIGYTILRPGYFMEVWLSPAVGFDAVNAKAQVYGTGENPISWISFADVAQFAVACLGHPAAQNSTLELGGPDALSQRAAIQIFEEVGGRPFELQYVPAEALAEQQRTSSDGMQQSFAGLMRVYAGGDPIDMDETLQTFPVQLTSVQEYAERVLGAS